MEVKSPGDKIEIRKDYFCEYDLKYIKFVTGMDDDEFFMWEALAEAKKAYDKEETPIGAVIVKDRRSNRKRTQSDRVFPGFYCTFRNTRNKRCWKYSWWMETFRMYALCNYGAMYNVLWCNSEFENKKCSDRCKESEECQDRKTV